MAKHIPHIFISKQDLSNLEIKDEDFGHLIRVLRSKVGDKFIALDNTGIKATCLIENISKNKMDFKIVEKEIFQKDVFEINLIQAITKIETFEEILDKSVQLGVSSITPLITENTNTSIDIFNKKTDRFNKIIKSASEQSQRLFLPELKGKLVLKDFYDKYNSENTFIAYEKSDTPFKTYLKGFSSNQINIVCGTEGGFSNSEAEYLREKFALFSLGKNILRAETAATSILANINYEIGI